MPEAVTVVFAVGRHTDAATVNLEQGTLKFDTGETTSFSGAILGGGQNSIVIASGAVTFTGDSSSYTGSPLVNGALTVGDGATSGAIAGDITVNGSLTFNRSDAVTYSGDITGGGNLIKDGAGTLTLTGFNTFFGTNDGIGWHT